MRAVFSIIIILFISCNKKVKINESRINRSITKKEFSPQNHEMFSNALSNHHYSYSFDNSEQTIQFNSNQLGSYLGGLKGIALYSGLNRAVLQANQKNGRKYKEYGDFYSLINYNKLLPEPLILNSDSLAKTFGFIENDQQSFAHYNKKMVEHLHQHFIPYPKDSIGNFTYQQIYNVVFKRFGRNLTDAYIQLKRKGFRKETKAYRTTLENIDSNGLNYLNQRYQHIKPEVPSTFSFSEMTPPIAIGFWLRRNIDGSRKEFWKGLSKIMYQYDQDWLIKKID